MSADPPRAVIEVPPDASHDFVWAGTRREQLRIPAACAPNSGDEGLCEQLLLAPSGDYEVVVAAYTACERIDESCACDTEYESGSCEIPNGQLVDVYGTRTAELAFPSMDRVEVVFE